MTEHAIRLGKQGEQKFESLMNRAGMPFINIDQRRDTYSCAFRAENSIHPTKRPDYLLPINGYGTIAVDVKHYKLEEDYFELEISEWSRYLNFYRLFMMNVWLAFVANNKTDEWYWFRVNKEVDIHSSGKIRLYIDELKSYDGFKIDGSDLANAEKYQRLLLGVTLTKTVLGRL